ncbi:MAG: proton-conducting transporter membrane subunit, partial [Candidatus Diapherotrites archaeon]|nr:proton-conducting transporter membrane subunit [Candidatus Diapherotrites archaeon]
MAHNRGHPAVIDFFVQHAPALAIALPLLGAFATPLVSKLGGKARDAWVLLILVLTGAIVALLAGDVLSTGAPRAYAVGATLPSITTQGGLPIRIIIEADAMSVFMAITAMTIALLAFIYSLRFLQKHKGLDKFYTLFLLMTAGMLGMMLTGDIFSLFVFFEMLSISSAGLIAFYLNRGEPAEAAFKYMVVSAIAGLFILFAAGILYSQYNILNMAGLASAMSFSQLDKIALVLLVAALALKCGAVPMHMWAIDAYGEAPAAISAFLVVASQTSLYALFRVCFSLFGATAT